MDIHSLSPVSQTGSPPPYSTTNKPPKTPKSPSTVSTLESGEKTPSRFKKFKTKVKNGFDKVKTALSPSSRKLQPESSAPILTPTQTPTRIKPESLIIAPPSSPSMITPVKIIETPKPVQTAEPVESERFYAWLEKWMMTIISKFDNLRSALWKFIQAIFGQESN